MPTGPGRTALAKPSPTPETAAVPQSGPMTSSPRSAPSSLSRISCSTGTLSLKSITFRPASSASIASENACGPGTETSERFAAVRRAADPVVRGGGAAPRPAEPDPPAEPGQRGVELGLAPRDRVVVVGADRDQQVVGTGTLGRLEAHAVEEVEVELGAHCDQRRLHTVDGGHRPADLHQGDRVVVGAVADLDCRARRSHQATKVSGRSARASACRVAASTPCARAVPEEWPTATNGRWVRPGRRSRQVRRSTWPPRGSPGPLPHAGAAWR